MQASNNFELCKLAIFAILEICKLANCFFSFEKCKLASFAFLCKLVILSFLRCASLVIFAILEICKLANFFFSFEKCKLANSFFSFEKCKLASFSFFYKLAILFFFTMCKIARLSPLYHCKKEGKSTIVQNPFFFINDSII